MDFSWGALPPRDPPEKCSCFVKFFFLGVVRAKGAFFSKTSRKKRRSGGYPSQPATLTNMQSARSQKILRSAGYPFPEPANSVSYCRKYIRSQGYLDQTQGIFNPPRSPGRP